MSELSFGAGQVTRRSVEATVIRACPACMAPGQFRSARIIRDGYSPDQIDECVRANPAMRDHERDMRLGWPECYVEPGDPRDGMPVGQFCPHCGAARPEDEVLGEISVTEFN